MDLAIIDSEATFWNSDGIGMSDMTLIFLVYNAPFKLAASFDFPQIKHKLEALSNRLFPDAADAIKQHWVRDSNTMSPSALDCHASIHSTL